MSELNAEGRRSSGQYIKLGDCNVRYFEEGEGKTLIFIHGIGQAMYAFRRNVHQLSEYCHVVTLDLLGHGLSDKPEDFDYNIEGFSQLISSFMDAMGIDKATLAGFSTGAVIALNVAIKYPEKVDKLILISPGCITKQYPTAIKLAQKPAFADLVFTFFNKHTVQKILTEAYYDPSFANADTVRHYYRVLSDKDNLDCAITSITEFNADYEEVISNLSEVKCPSFVFWGENDLWHPIQTLELFEDNLQDIYVATIAECGHFMHEEKSEEFNQKVSDIMLVDF